MTSKKATARRALAHAARRALARDFVPPRSAARVAVSDPKPCIQEFRGYLSSIRYRDIKDVFRPLPGQTEAEIAEIEQALEYFPNNIETFYWTAELDGHRGETYHGDDYCLCRISEQIYVLFVSVPDWSDDTYAIYASKTPDDLFRFGMEDRVFRQYMKDCVPESMEINSK
jgi:hypothetical protein